MKLSELHTNERGIIVKVYGHGGFRKRIIEMGFIKGKDVEVMQNAPLQDPVKYKIMGYEVSLRRSEADMIEVVTSKEAMHADKSDNTGNASPVPPLPATEELLHQAAQQKRRTINVALVGNPNCGKTSLFNFASGAHERVGNYSGVTVDAKEGYTEFEGYRINLVDLPGTYSLSAYSPEELYVRRQIIDKTPDVVLNIIDASNIERNLYLTTQLLDMHIRMVCALNMFDEFKRRGDSLRIDTLEQLLGVPIEKASFKTGQGVENLLRTIIRVYEGEEPKARHIHVNHGKDIEEAIDPLHEMLHEEYDIRHRYSTRYLAIKMLEGDRETEKVIASLRNSDVVRKLCESGKKHIQEETKQDAETAIMDAKYGFIHGALQEAEYTIGNDGDTYKMTHLIDQLLTHRWLGFPLFFVILFMMFHLTFTIGQYPMDWIEAGVERLSATISGLMADGPLKAMIVDGVIGGVGSVIVFLPQILILYAFISFMEDSGYMSRAAFIMDKLMHKIGLHGKSFIPLVMGFGCNVPAVMATRTIESRRSRLITMLVLPFMSCSARLPIYIMIVGTFFAAEYRSWVLILLYATGILVAAVMSRILSQFVIKGEDTPFVMELPPYRFPTGKAIMRHTWEKGKQYLRKMGGIILVASLIVWALGYFPHNEELTTQQQQEQSYIGRIGKAIEPVFEPLGFNWKLDVGIVSGIGAKEIVASTMGVLYSGDDSFADNDSFAGSDKYASLHEKMSADGVTTLSAISFLLFVLLYFPCLATIIAIKNESGSWSWGIFTIIYTTAIAWVTSMIVYQLGSLLGL